MNKKKAFELEEDEGGEEGLEEIGRCLVLRHHTGSGPTKPTPPRVCGYKCVVCSVFLCLFVCVLPPRPGH